MKISKITECRESEVRKWKNMSIFKDLSIISFKSRIYNDKKVICFLQPPAMTCFKHVPPALWLTVQLCLLFHAAIILHTFVLVCPSFPAFPLTSPSARPLSAQSFFQPWPLYVIGPQVQSPIHYKVLFDYISSALPSTYSTFFVSLIRP